MTPVCLHLNEEVKQNFENKADRSSDKAKVFYMLKSSTKIIENMMYEKKLSRI